MSGTAPKRLVVGVDPGSGASSPTGFACFYPEERLLVHTEDIWPSEGATEYRDRYRQIAGRVHELLEFIDPELDVLVVCESFVMRGKGGEILARLTGALMAAIPEHHRFAFVQNSSVKKVVGGHGQAEKEIVARGVLNFFEQAQAVADIIAAGRWDLTDALAIGITGYLKDIGAA